MIGQASDRVIWDFAKEERRIVISKDEDFFILACRASDHGRLLWPRTGNCRTRSLLKKLEQHWEEIEEAFESGQQIVEIR